MVKAERPQRSRHHFGCGRLGDADAHAGALAVLGLLGIGPDRLHLREGTPSPSTDRFTRRRQAHLPAAAGPDEV